MPIVTRCKACDTVEKAIKDRCKYCGSQRLEVKTVADEMIGRSGNRYFLINRKPEKDNGSKRSRPQT